MAARHLELLESRSVRAQLVGDDNLRCEALFSEQLAHQSDGRAFITPALNQDAGSRPRDRPHAIGTFFCRQSGQPSRRDATSCSPGDDAAATVMPSSAQISAPNCGRSRTRGPDPAQRGDPRRPESSARSAGELDSALDNDRRKSMPAIRDRCMLAAYRRSGPAARPLS
jgi:hypothetical protein